MKSFTNSEVAKMLRSVAAALTLKNTGNVFQIRAYENAADSIEHLTTSIKDLWEEGNLADVAGLGESLRSHLDELFTTGKVKHWLDLKKGIPEAVFELLGISGIGPQTALKLSKMGVKNENDLRDKLKRGVLTKKGFSQKLADKLQVSIKYPHEDMFEGRMLLPYAFNQADKILGYLKQSPLIKKADALGSLRRMVATVGDLDFAVASNNPPEALDYIARIPGAKIKEKGKSQATLTLSSGISVDFIVVESHTYGALLQHFTGSKAHNIHLRMLAQKKGLSLSEYFKSKTEEELYGLLGMQTPPPEIREDKGEIELALSHKLPNLVDLKDIKGDLHTHSDFITKPAHDIGANSIKEITGQAKQLGYEYVGITDHQPSQSGHNEAEMVNIIQKKKEAIEQINSSQESVRVLNLLEVDILASGRLGMPDEALKLLDFAVASVHSNFNMTKDQMTARILNALANPYVKVLGHPTGRLLGKRQSYEADWRKVFEYAEKNRKAIEINAYPNRLDLPDDLVFEARKMGVKFVIDTDSHMISSMENMRFGVAVARRGWATKEDVVNAWDWTTFAKWFNIGE